MCLAWTQSFSKLRQNITNLWTFKHAYPRHLGALQKTPNLQRYYSSNKLVLCWLPGQPKPQNMPEVLGEHQFIMLENVEIIYISINRTVPFMSQSFIAFSAILCPFMPNDRSLWVSSLMPSIPPQKFLCRLRLALFTHYKVHISCFRIETYLLRRHTPKGHIVL